MRRFCKTRRLRESAGAHLLSALRLAGWSIFFVIAVVASAATINSWTIGRTIINRIRLLRDGASIIGQGNLDHRIDIKGDDEFADLSKAFNAMTVKLQASYLELKNEIVERKRAEEETHKLLNIVQEERDRLSALINSISDEIWFTDSQKRFTLANPSALREFGIGDGNEITVEKLAASLEVYRPDGSPRPIEEAPPLRALQGEIVTQPGGNYPNTLHRRVAVSPGQFRPGSGCSW